MVSPVGPTKYFKISWRLKESKCKWLPPEGFGSAVELGRKDGSRNGSETARSFGPECLGHRTVATAGGSCEFWKLIHQKECPQHCFLKSIKKMVLITIITI